MTKKLEEVFGFPSIEETNLELNTQTEPQIPEEIQQQLETAVCHH